jgi:hypothetical protein
MTISRSEWFWSCFFVALVTAVGLTDVSEFIVGSSGQVHELSGAAG